MAAISGTWRQSRQIQAGAAIWGTGWNPVHMQRQGYGRNVAPHPSDVLVDPLLTQQYETNPEGGFTTEDFHIIDTLGYGTQTGTADRPGLGMPDSRADSDGYPSWPQNGEQIRAENHGADRTNLEKVIPDHDAAQGWLNKDHGDEGFSEPSDPSQYEIATSMRQRHEVRAGSQVPEGRANHYDAPIESRIVGQKKRFSTTPLRHEEMDRASQSISIRGFWNRSAGTGPVNWMEPNAMYQSEPMQRTVPADPYQGQEIGGNEYQIDEGWYY